MIPKDLILQLCFGSSISMTMGLGPSLRKTWNSQCVQDKLLIPNCAIAVNILFMGENSVCPLDGEDSLLTIMSIPLILNQLAIRFGRQVPPMA